MANVSLIDGHLDNAEHCVCCGAVIPEGRQVCIICGKKVNGKQRQIERIRISLMKTVLKRLVEKQIPKKPNIHGYREGREINTISYTCPICNKHIGREDFCKHCGQALFWESEE